MKKLLDPIGKIAMIFAVAISLIPQNVFSAPQSSSNWQQQSQGMYGGIITAYALSSAFATDQTLFAGTSEAGVFKSTNGGDSWVESNQGRVYN